MFWTHNWGLVDSLKCRAFINRNPAIQSKKAKKDLMYRLNYASIKDQCYFEIRNFINKIAITKDNIHIYWRPVAVLQRKSDEKTSLTPDIIRKRLVEEMDAIVEIDIDKDSTKKIIKKKDLKEKIWRSSDLWDCLIFRMYWEIKRKRKVFVYNSES